jgi:hypothetical protein
MTVPGIPSRIIPTLMRDYYEFPQISDDKRRNSPRPKIGVISLGGNFLDSDISTYFDRIGLTEFRPTVTRRFVDGYTPPLFRRDSESIENTLDIELIGGFCPSSDISVYFSANTALGYYRAFEAAFGDRMDIVSTSWGASEDSFYTGTGTLLDSFNALFYKWVRGRDPTTGEDLRSSYYPVITAATGDYGSSDNDTTEYSINGVSVPVPHAGFPASSPWVVACGGTSLFLDPFLSNKTESAWVYTGSGQSSRFEMPDYQSSFLNAINLPFDNSNRSPIAYGALNNPWNFRDQSRAPRIIPDIVFNADPNSPWEIFFSGYVDEGAGTSASAPIMGALLGEFYVYSKENSAPRSGYFGESFNFYLYNSVSTDNFKPIVIGDNITVNRNPITREPNPYGKYTPDPVFYKGTTSTNVAQSFNSLSGHGIVRADRFVQYLDSVVCVVANTEIETSSGRMPISQIVRGTRVLSHFDNAYVRVSRVLTSKYSLKAVIGIVEFKEDSLGQGTPYKSLIITENHPLLIDARSKSRAGDLTSLPGVQSYSGRIGECPFISPKDYLTLYDLQFDETVYYTANGVQIQSRSPLSVITPLPRSEYWDESKYSHERVWD